MRVVVSAYACEPGMGSEPGIGWNWVRQIARFHQVWVITRPNSRHAIEAALAKEPLPNVQWVYYDLPRWACLWKSGVVGSSLRYYLWQLGAYFVGRKLHRQVRLDLIHHVTIGCYWRPSFLALLPVRFVWGPVGGGESAPRAFSSTFSLRGKTYELFRDIARAVPHLDPFVRFTARRAAVGLATTEETAARMRKLGCRELSILSQVALPSEEITMLANMPMRRTGPFRLLSVGRFIHWKGFELGLKAFGQFHTSFPSSEYWLIGDGPERKRLERLTRELGVAERVTFWGALPRVEALAKLAECDVLVHPSLHDSGGWVCAEAMAAGRPVICLDLGGPALQVTEETGIKVPAISPEQAVRDLAAAMHKLAADPDLRARMGRADRERVERDFDWHKKCDLMMRIYQTVANAQNTAAKADSLNARMA